MTHDYLTFEESIDVILEHLDGRMYSFKECGIGVRDFSISSPYYSTEYESVEGVDGSADMGTTLGYRQIKMELYFVSDGVENYAYKRDEVFSILESRQAFYVTESRAPHKRWLVKVNGIFEPDQRRIFGFFSVNLNSASPFAQSPGTTLNPSDYTQMNQVQEANFGDPPIQYRFAETSFFVWNDGEKVDPRQHYLRIAFKGESTNLTIKNLTNGTEWRYNGTSASGDVILLDGIKSLKNGVSIFKNTNKKLIEISPGWNEFKITGATDFEISFDFKYLYI